MDKGLNLTLNLKRELEIDLRLRIIKLADMLAEANANSPEHPSKQQTAARSTAATHEL